MPSADELDSFLVQLKMLQDRVRTAAYQRAIAAAVRPGDHVLDFGCGSGVLAVLAARAGAERVYAVERSRLMAAGARAVYAANGCDQIVQLEGDSSEVALPGPVDLIVSDWMGHFLFSDYMFDALLKMRDEHLKPDGRMLPERISLHAGLVIDPALHAAVRFLHDKPYGIDFSVLADGPQSMVDAKQLSSDQVLPGSAQIAAFDMRTTRGLSGPLRGVMVSDRSASVVGLCGWFDAVLTRETVLSTSPFAVKTHWSQAFFPFDRPLPVRAGANVEIEIDVLLHPETYHFFWKARSGSEERRGDDVLLEASLLTSRR